MKRNVFRTKNQVFIQRFVFIVGMMAVLTALFLILSNLGIAADIFHLDPESAADVAFDAFSEMTESERKEVGESIQAASVSGDDNPTVDVYDPRGDATMILTQLTITKQPYTMVDSLSQVEDTTQILIVNADRISESDTKTLQKLVNKGVSLLVTGLPDEESLSNEKLLSLLGIEEENGEATWKGVRTSSDLLTGTMIEKPNYKTSGIDVKLTNNCKIYVCALPEKYQDIDNEDLPPLIWRYIADGEGKGRVYVFNGDFMTNEMGYGIVPKVLSEIRHNYIYPIINAYCVTATSFPYADNEVKDSWTRLYSRDKQLIQQDMLVSQLKRYSSVYGVRLTCFTADLDTFENTTDTSLAYVRDEIESSQGMLAWDKDGILSLEGGDQATRIMDWDNTFTFWNADTGTITLPICFNSTIDEPEAEEYVIAGFGSTMGYYAVNIDYGDFLEYEGEDDVWTIYSEKQETMIGTQQEDYGWMDRVTMEEAFARTLSLLTMDMDIQYNADNIRISIDDFNEEAWFILRSDEKNLTVDNGTIEEIGTNCYFITLTDAEAEITWEDE